MHFQHILIFASCWVCSIGEVLIHPPSSTNLVPKIDFYIQELKAILEGEEKEVIFGFGWGNGTNDKFYEPYQISVVSENPGILEIVNVSNYLPFDPENGAAKNFSFTVKGVFLGYTKVLLKMGDEMVWPLAVSVVRPHTPLVDIVTGVMAAFVAFNYINMGVLLDLHSIGKVLKRPVGPTIGFVCQFLFMPLASFGISLLLLDDISLRLGLFTLGCSPGGSMSNFWTLLFDGDVNLSVTMTFISTIAALAMMPLWIFTLGASLFRDRQATIPFLNLAGSLIILTLPIGIGLLIQQYSPRLTDISRKIIKPFTIVCVLVGISVGLYANSFVFSLFTWQVVLAGLGIAWGGYCFGALVAWLCRLDRSQIIAVSIETAFQNPAVAFVMLVLSLPQPDADLSSVPVIAQLMLTGLPMWALLVVRSATKKVKSYLSQKDQDELPDKPEIDTVQKAYSALQMNAPEAWDSD